MTKPSKVTLSPGVDAWLRKAKDAPALIPKYKKVRKAIRFMREVGPSHPGFETHAMSNLKGPEGRQIWNSYIENHTPGAWRMYWIYGTDGEVYVTSVGPHDHAPGGASG
ncbi:MAG: hypothetical protein WBB00_07960 [Mycobacterium sp.]